MLNDYVKNSSTTQHVTPLNQLSSAADFEKPQEEQKTITVMKNGKKKIKPVVEQMYQDTGELVNPHMNPFTQLNDAGEAKAVDVVMDDNTKSFNLTHPIKV